MSGRLAILLLEDDAMIRAGLEYALEQEGYAVAGSASVAEAKQLLAAGQRFDLALLDMNLPDGTGFDVRPALRGWDTAVIFLTVVDDEGNIVRAFEEGADDYITKPFRLSELLARIKRTLAGRSRLEGPAVVRFADILLDTGAGKVWRGEQLLDLTALEYRLLLLFAGHIGQVLTREQIRDGIWGADGAFVEDNTLSVYIKRLRDKLGDQALIETVRGLGYRASVRPGPSC